MSSIDKTSILSWLSLAVNVLYILYQLYGKGFSAELFINIFMFFVLSAMIYYLSKVRKTLDVISVNLNAWSSGNLEGRIVSITEGSNLGKAMWDLNEFVDTIDSFVRESTASMDAVTVGKFYRKFITIGTRGAFKRGAVSINAALDNAHKKSAILERALAELEKNVSSVLEDVKSASGTVNQVCAELVDLSNDSLAKTKEVASDSVQAQGNVDSVANSSNELSVAVSEISRKVIESNSIVHEAMAEAESSKTKMQALKSLSQEVNNITAMINNIAEQTNLLALNATIESARAGEAGKGFAVVAGEVKNLAAQTVSATAEISSRLGSMQGSVDELVEVFQGVVYTISRVSEISTVISAAIEEQSASTREISHNMVQAASNTKRVTGNLVYVGDIVCKINNFSGTVNDAASQLSQRIVTLSYGVDSFKQTIKA
jgi:methyl-accepting chemotaxis protein